MANRFILRYSVIGIGLVCFGLFIAIRNQPNGSGVRGHHRSSLKHNNHNLQLGRGTNGRHMQEFKEEPEEMSDDYSSYFYGSSYSLSISSSFYGNNSRDPTSFSSSSDSYVDEEGARLLEKLRLAQKEKRKMKLARRKAERAAKLGDAMHMEVPEAAKLRLKDGNVIDEEGNVIRKLEKKQKAEKNKKFQSKKNQSKKDQPQNVHSRKGRSVVRADTLEADEWEEFNEKVELRQIDRQIQMRNYCGADDTRRHDEISEYTKGHLLVIPEYRLLYCYVPKAGCTNWKRIMMVLSGQSDSVYSLTSDEVHVKSQFQFFSALSLAKQQEVLDTYFKFAFVREPMERLLSVYRNKFGDKKQYKKGTFHAFGKGIIKEFRQNATKYNKMSGVGVTWLEFIKYLLSPDVRRTYEDTSDIYRKDHWEIQARICSPCDVRYDFIGHMESIDEEAIYLLRRWNAQDKVKYLTQDKNRFTNSSDSTIFNRNYGLLQAEQKENIYDMFKDDYEAFGYKTPSFISGGNNI